VSAAAALLRRLEEARTARLRLTTITPELLDADIAADGSLARALRARVTPEWPPEAWEPHVLAFIRKQTLEDPRTAGWNRYVIEARSLGWRRTLVGAVGAFAKADGDVELGYSTLPAFQRRGYAVEAVQALIALLFEDPHVLSVSAQTHTHMTESIKVMERCGLMFVGEGDEAGTVRYRRVRRGEISWRVQE
jgi:RimJ/RimL family protein N-acetyltransferase